MRAAKQPEIVEVDGTKCQQVTEGKATIVLPTTVFYNPVQEFNRDLTIAVVGCFAKLKEPGLTSVIGEKQEHGLKVLEALAASGLRSCRFAKELGCLNNVVANDYSAEAVSFIERNIERNDAGHLVQASKSDAAMLMYQKKRFFDVVDLDPYGSPSQFLDAGVQAVCEGGLLCVTATDMPVLVGLYPETSFATYGSVTIKGKFCHEMALRVLLRSIETAANRHGRYIEPLLSVSADFYVRIFMRVKSGAALVKDSATKQSHVLHCGACGTFRHLPLAKRVTSETSSHVKFVASDVATWLSARCEFCGGKVHLGGPMWSAPLHDQEFVRKLREHVTGTAAIAVDGVLPSTAGLQLGTRGRIEGLLVLAEEEVPDAPLYYILDQVCKVVHAAMPTLVEIRSAILHLGYPVSFSHCAKNSIKTTCPPDKLWDIFRSWVKLKPIAEKWKTCDTPGTRILAKPILTEGISFEVREDANPRSRLEKFLRYQLNPTADWGPRAKAKLCGGEKVLVSEVQKRLANQNKRGARDARNANASHNCKRLKTTGSCEFGEMCRYNHDFISTSDNVVS